jgi:hypothetical protein
MINCTFWMQAAFRGFQVRRQYRKILWSVGVLEKAVLRWRLKRKGFRGLHIDPIEADPDPKHESDTEEDFYRASRMQAEERIERSVVRVQALFRSKKAQEEYRRMKITHNEAKVGDSHGGYYWCYYLTGWNEQLTNLTLFYAAGI